MSITSIFADPTVGLVNTETGLSIKGSVDGTEPRWFLRAKPLGSTLALGRLTEPKLKPDVAGAYTVAVKDVTVTTPVERWKGDPLATAATHDEATAPEVTLVYWVAEPLSRAIGAGRGTATLSLYTYADQADETRTTDVKLTAVANAAAPVVIGPDTLADPYLAGALAELKTALSLSTFLGPGVGFLADLWRGLYAHVSGETLAAHGGADATPTPSGAPTTLAGCQSLLTALAAELLAHEARGPTEGVHASVAPATPLATQIGTTLAQACAYAAALDRAFVWHATTTFNPSNLTAIVHVPPFADWTEGRWREPPYDLTTLCSFSIELAARLAGHKARTADPGAVAHLALTSQALPNPFVQGMSAQDAFNAVGQMIDSFSTHVQSYQNDSPAGAHTAKRAAPGLTKPADPARCAMAVEALALALEAHALDADAHGGRTALGATRARAGTDPETARWPYTLRLSARLNQLLSSATPPVPENRNSAATLWKLFGGWT